MHSKKIIRDHITFRTILAAMSHPGKVYRLPEFEKEETAVVELLRCLLDNEVGVAVVGDPTLESDLFRHTECRRVSCEEADFIIIGHLADSAALTGCKVGSLEYPDGGATILYLVDGLSEGDGGIVLSGPGVDDKISLRISGLAAGELSRLQDLNSEFPLGVDAMFFVRRRNGRIACIPRSSQIRVN
jgi:alpha-D-ribose 1-methylphosphonate 5-triphosphate synthase subunit PhnH